MKKGLYKHYKGKYYEVLDIVRNSDNCKKEFVLYRQLEKSDFPKGSMWYRSVDKFNEKFKFVEGQRNYTELMFAGNTAQLEKLIENEHKWGFDNIDINYAKERVFDEFIELRQAIKQEGLPKITKLNMIRREAADVSNFAHMIILACDKKIKENKQ